VRHAAAPGPRVARFSLTHAVAAAGAVLVPHGPGTRGGTDSDGAACASASDCVEHRRGSARRRCRRPRRRSRRRRRRRRRRPIRCSQTGRATPQTAKTIVADGRDDVAERRYVVAAGLLSQAEGRADPRVIASRHRLDRLRRRRRRSKEEVANGRARDGAPATSTTDQAHIAAAFCDFVSTCCSDEQTRCVRSPRQAATVTRGRSRGMRGERGEYERDAARPRALRSRRHAVGSVRPSHDAAGSGSDRDHAPLRSRDDRARRRASQPRLRRVPRRAEPLPPRRPRGRSPRFRPSPLVGEGARVPRS